jgi:hypothetical protein
MKDSTKGRPSSHKAHRARGVTPARQRPTIAVRLEPTSYEKIVALADAAHISVTAQTERMLEKALEPNFAGYSLEAYGAHVMAAFRMGGQLAAGRDRPYEDWIKDPAVCEPAAALAIRALLSWLPKPLCDLRDAAGNPIGVLGARIALSANPADAGKLHFITPDENKNED